MFTEQNKKDSNHVTQLERKPIYGCHKRQVLNARNSQILTFATQFFAKCTQSMNIFYELFDVLSRINGIISEDLKEVVSFPTSYHFISENHNTKTFRPRNLENEPQNS